MARRLDTRFGAIGYLDQIDRIRRFVERVTAPRVNEDWERFIADYQDDVFSFFQHCWHLKDWIRNDPELSGEQKKRIIEAAEHSKVLAIANDMANGTKHLRLYEPKAGAGYACLALSNAADFSTVDCQISIDGDDRLQSGRRIAVKCVEEWEKILRKEKLPVRRRS